MDLQSELLPVHVAWPLLAECFFKSLGVLAVAGLAVLVLRQASAAVKHLVWLVALLDQSRSRRALSRTAITLAAALIAAVVVPVAMVEAEADDPKTGVAEAQDTESGDATDQKDEKPDAESQRAAGQNGSEPNAGGGEITSEDPNDKTLGPPPGLNPRETVRGFLDQLAEGKKTINEIHRSWDHAWAWTTRQHGMDLSTPLAKRPNFKPIAHLGNDKRMMVLTGTARENASSVQDRVGVFELVRRDDRWLIEKMMLRSPESAWAYAAGFARSDKVQWHVLRSDLVGEWRGGGLLPTSLNIEADGTFAQRTGCGSEAGANVEKGTWQLDGRRLTLRIDETTMDRSQRAAKPTRVRRVQVEGEKLVMEQITDGELTGNRWTYHRPDAQADRSKNADQEPDVDPAREDNSTAANVDDVEFSPVREVVLPTASGTKRFLTLDDGERHTSLPEDRPALSVGYDPERADELGHGLYLRFHDIHNISVPRDEGIKLWRERTADQT